MFKPFTSIWPPKEEKLILIKINFFFRKDKYSHRLISFTQNKNYFISLILSYFNYKISVMDSKDDVSIKKSKANTSISDNEGKSVTGFLVLNFFF